MPHATAKGAPAATLTAKAPSATAGHKASPKRKSAASAMPEGGQTSVAKPATAPSRRPRRAVTKYAPKTNATLPR